MSAPRCFHCLMNPAGQEDRTSEFSRNLHHGEAPRAAYQKGGNKTTFHWGQRKLHLSEVDFLSQAIRKMNNKLPKGTQFPQVVVVYAGAAPARHTNLLSDMFPWILFILVDPARFAIGPTRNPQGGGIEIINDFFTDDLARDLRERYRGWTRLFICDIRGRVSDRPEAEVEAEVAENMAMQMRWHRILEPSLSMLKFRPPYIAEREEINQSRATIRYLGGVIRYQIWAGPSSSETRLIVSQESEDRDYDSRVYEDEMYYFNTRVRPSTYSHSAAFEIPGFDQCYDCTAECVTHANYLQIRDAARGWHATGETLREFGLDYPESMVPEIRRYVRELTDHLGDMRSKIHLNGREINASFRHFQREMKNLVGWR
jgi:hypothetical protein